MLETYHCWWPLQEHTPHICHWELSDISSTDLSPTYFLECLFNQWLTYYWTGLIDSWWTYFLDGQAKRSLIVLLPDPRWLIIVRLPFWAVSSLIDLCLAMIWPSQIVQHSTISGSIIMWYEISWLLLEAFSFPFCKMHDQDSFS